MTPKLNIKNPASIRLRIPAVRNMLECVENFRHRNCILFLTFHKLLDFKSTWGPHHSFKISSTNWGIILVTYSFFSKFEFKFFFSCLKKLRVFLRVDFGKLLQYLLFFQGRLLRPHFVNASSWQCITVAVPCNTGPSSQEEWKQRYMPIYAFPNP